MRSRIPPRHAPLRIRATLLVAGMLASGSAVAGHAPALDRATLWLGGYYARSDTTLGGRTADGTLDGQLHLEKDLGLNTRDGAPRARLDLLLGDSQGFSFDYYRYDRSNSRRLSRRIDYRGNIYAASARVDARLRFDFGSAAYRWWFGTGSNAFGLGLGAGYYSVDGRVSGQATVNGSTTTQATSEDREHAWAPLLQLGWRHAFNDHWRMYLDASGVKKNGGRLHGHVYNADLGVQWLPTGHLGLSAEYGINRIHLYQTHHSYDDRLKLNLDGPSVFVTLRF